MKKHKGESEWSETHISGDEGIGCVSAIKKESPHGEGVMDHVKEKMSDVNERFTDLCGGKLLLNNNRAYKQRENVRNKMC